MPLITTNDDVIDTPCLEYAQEYVNWELIHDLLGGTDTMRGAGERWLPKEPNETPKSYDVRRSRSFLFPGYKDSLRKLSSRPFGRAVFVDGLDPEWTPFLRNVDQAGTDITSFTKAVFEDALTYGKTFMFVDFPFVEGQLNKAQAEKLRPFVKHVTAPQLISWESEVDPETGEHRLVALRFREVKTVRSGTYSTKREHWLHSYRVGPDDVDYEAWKSVDTQVLVRNNNPNYFQTLESINRREWSKVRTGKVTFQINGRPAIPLVPIYFNKKGYMIAEPPLLELAWVNLAHWQSSSDQRNILRFARIAQIFARGFTPDDFKNMKTASVNNVWSSKDPQADIKYVEHSGAAIKAGADDLEHLEEIMNALGMQPLLERTIDQTATGVVVDAQRTNSDILAWIESMERGLYQVLEHASLWLGQILPEKVVVNIFSDFGAGAAPDTFSHVIELGRMGRVTGKTMLREAKRRSILAENLDIESEDAEAMKEAEKRLELTLASEEDAATEKPVNA